MLDYPERKWRTVCTSDQWIWKQWPQVPGAAEGRKGPANWSCWQQQSWWWLVGARDSRAVAAGSRHRQKLRSPDCGQPRKISKGCVPWWLGAISERKGRRGYMWGEKGVMLKEFVSAKIFLFSSYQCKTQKFTSKSCENGWRKKTTHGKLYCPP